MLPLFSLVHLRRQFDQGVKVSCPLGTCDVLDVVRQSGRVRCLPVNLLHLEKMYPSFLQSPDQARVLGGVQFPGCTMGRG